MVKPEKPKKLITQANEERIDQTLFRAEISKAAERIGTTTDKVGTWLVRFAGLDLITLSMGRWTDLQYEVVCLAEHYQPRDSAYLWQHVVTSKRWDGTARQSTTTQEIAFIETTSDYLLDPSLLAKALLPSGELPPREVIKDIQREVISVFHELDQKKPVLCQFPPLKVLVTTDHTTDETIVVGIAEKPQHLFHSNVIFILAENAVRIRRCSECKSWFFADRKNKTYCSLKCQSRAGTRRWRDTPSHQIGKQGRPAKKINDRLKGGKHGKKGR
jgi:hypothetical protein